MSISPPDFLRKIRAKVAEYGSWDLVAYATRFKAARRRKAREILPFITTTRSGRRVLTFNRDAMAAANEVTAMEQPADPAQTVVDVTGAAFSRWRKRQARKEAARVVYDLGNWS